MPPHTAGLPAHRLVRILLVDHQPAFCRFARALLHAQPGLQVVGEAGSGAQALTLLRPLEPDVALVEVELPGDNGFALTRRMRAICPGLLVVLLSAYDEPSYEPLARAAGAAAWLPKRDFAGMVASGFLGHPAIAGRPARPSLEQGG
jgi:DNA-binding NarL/FixJ family response regulator